ncbi:hypothetical protein VaNZ11_013684 [Volvox africanus]|uniref:HVA22-like protein n=1 Tax=Volvox africanus TaxID=51714 RepID=A0ABQ5SHJ7_9CHLO|nr:hypothetical protein VaNZ11_013684 [Volvox africanus]
MWSLSLSYYLCLITQVVYPTYASLKAIQSVSKVDDTQWLTYWVIYAISTTFEAVAEFVLEWIPLYYEIKLLIIIWMIAPGTQGARKLYEEYILPQFLKHDKFFERFFGKADAALNSDVVNTIAKLVDTKGPAIAEQVLKQAQEQALKAVKLAQAQAQTQAAMEQNKVK